AMPSLGELLSSRSLDEAAVLRSTEATPDFPILPWANMIKIGGQSLIDRGRAAVYPLVEEIVANLGRHKMLIGPREGNRARDVCGAPTRSFVTDEDGLLTADPKKDPAAQHSPRLSLHELLQRDLNGLIVERAVLEFMAHARHIREIQFVNGLRPGQLAAALE